MERLNSMGGGMYKSMNLDDLIREHKRVVAVLESTTHEDDKREAETQKKELEGYIAKKKKLSKGKGVGNLIRRVINNKLGRKQTVWVKPNEAKEQTKNKLAEVDAELFDRVKRKKEGKGKEITLTEKEVKEVLQYGQIGFVSAGRNPADKNDVKLSDKQISERYNKLRGDLIKKGYTFVKVKGKYGKVEDSFMVMVNDVNKKDLQAIGTAYNQDSVIYSNGNRNELIYTTGENKHKKNKGSGFKWLGDGVSDFYSEIKTKKGNMRFRLNFNFNKLSKAMIEKAFGKKDTSKLVKRPIVDSKGVKRMVWVDPNKDKPKQKREKKQEDEPKERTPKQEEEGGQKSKVSEEDRKAFEITDKDKSMFTKMADSIKGWVDKQKHEYDEDGDGRADTSLSDRIDEKRTAAKEQHAKTHKKLGYSKEEISADWDKDEKMHHNAADEEAKLEIDTEKMGSSAEKVSMFLKRKMKGIVKGVKHEVEEWKAAGHGISKFAKGEKLTSHEKKAIRDVAIHMGIVVAIAASGGSAAGATFGAKAAAIGGKIGLGYLEHAGLMRAGHALLFAKGENEVYDILKAIEESANDDEAEHNIERLVMSMANYIENHHGQESKKEEDGESNG